METNVGMSRRSWCPQRG